MDLSIPIKIPIFISYVLSNKMFIPFIRRRIWFSNFDRIAHNITFIKWRAVWESNPRRRVCNPVPVSIRPTAHLVRPEGVEPSRHKGHWFLRPAAQPLAYRTLQATHTGFEPVISTVTGWRPLQTGPMGRVVFSVAEAPSRFELAQDVLQTSPARA